MRAFDINDIFIGAVTVPDSIGLTLSLSLPGIHSVRISQTQSDIAFDDLVFDTPTAASVSEVPVPSGLLLAGIGAMLVGGLQWKRAKFLIAPLA